jgi:hypothetical protein
MIGFSPGISWEAKANSFFALCANSFMQRNNGFGRVG